MAKVKGAVVFAYERCKGCEVCIPVCRTNVIKMAKEVNSKGYRYAYMALEDECNGCESCALVCPDGVITVYRKKLDNLKSE